MSKKALVTGASGFIGSGLIRDLATQGFEVHALMRKASSDANLKALGNDFSYSRVEGDLSDRESLQRAVQGMDYVFHLAGAVVAPNREGFFRHNAEGTRNLAEAVAEQARAGRPLKRFVYVSSLAAGGPAQTLTPRTEEESDQPVSAYGASKLEGEKELLRFKDLYPVSIVRPPLVYGPRDKATFLFVQTVTRRVVPSFGNKYYSMVHVDDLCRGIIGAGVAEITVAPSGEIFYIAGDGHLSYGEMMGTIAAHLKIQPFHLPVPTALLKPAAYALTALGKLTGRTYPLNLDKLNEIEPDYWICSNHKAKRLLGFEPKFAPSDGWADAIRWYKEMKWIE